MMPMCVSVSFHLIDVRVNRTIDDNYFKPHAIKKIDLR